MAWIYKPKKTRRIDTARAERMKIYNTKRWRRLRLSHLRLHPLCQICEREGRVTPGNDVHHITSFTSVTDKAQRELLAYDPANLMTVCDSCHAKIHNHSKSI